MLFSVGLKTLDYRLRNGLFQFHRTFASVAGGYVIPKEEDEYTAVPQYPPIEPVDEKTVERKTAQAWHDKIKRQKTVEEKLFEINVPRYWGWKCLLLKEGEIPYNNLEFAQFITRTHLVETTEFPAHYQDLAEKSSSLVREIAERIKLSIVENHYKIRHARNVEKSVLSSDREFRKIIVNELHRLILISLQKENLHLQSSQTDYDPRLESFWYLGSLPDTYVPEIYEHGLKPEEIPEEYLGRPSDKFIQYLGNPIIQLRLMNPLPPILNLKDAIYLRYPVPVYEYDPFNVFDYEMVRRHVTNIPGFWPGEPREFSCLSYHDCNHLNHRNESFGVEDAEEALQCQAILSSFAWLMSIASYQGFTNYHEITYPFLTQTVLTDGKNFSFAVYQLNTTEFYHEDPYFNPKSNICWMTPKMPLYDIVNDQITGINEDVIKLLLQFYMNKPEDKDLVDRKPFLDEKIGVVANYEHEEKRCWLEKNFKHFSVNAPKHRVDRMYELADYERIYKVMFKRFVRDPRRRPFELRENPYLRKMSEVTPPYIPRKLRPDKDLPKWRQQKFRKTYYPE